MLNIDQNKIIQHFSIFMRKPQQLGQSSVKTENSQECNANRHSQSSITLHRDKSIPKFNRKTEIRPFSRKRGANKQQPDQPICYISPNRSGNDLNSRLRSPKFQEVAHQFSSSIFGDSTERDLDLNFSSRIKLSMQQSREMSQRSIQMSNRSRELSHRSRNDREQIEQYIEEIEELKRTVSKLEKENLNLKEKGKQLSEVKAFLVQRESFIFNITLKNKLLEDQNNEANQKINELENNHAKEIADVIQKNKRQMKSALRQLDVQKTEIRNILKTNSSLKEQIRLLKKAKSLEKKNAINRKCKQNNEHFNRNKKKNLNKSKTLVCISQKESETAPKQKSQTIEKQSTCSTLLQKKENGRKSIDRSATFSGSFTKKDQECEFQEANNEIEPLKEIVKKLNQKLRYSQIQVDILKKTKFDINKIKQQNENLKQKNRRLLSRVDFLSSKQKKRNHSNSSLELSLSPRKI